MHRPRPLVAVGALLRRAWLRPRHPGLAGLLWLSALRAMAAGDAAQAASTALRFAPEKDYGPFVYQQADGQVRGLSVDLLHLVAGRAGLQLHTLPPQPLDQILAQARAGQVDLISSLRANPERAAYLDFSAPYVEVPAVLVLRATDNAVTQPGQLGASPVAVGRSYAVEGYVRQRWPQVGWAAVSDDAAGMEALRQGRVRALVADAASVAWLWRPGDARLLRVGPEVGFAYALSFAVRKGDAATLGRINQALATLGPAERGEVLRRWMPAPLPAPTGLRELALWAGAACILAALLGGVWLVRTRARRQAGTGGRA